MSEVPLYCQHALEVLSQGLGLRISNLGLRMTLEPTRAECGLLNQDLDAGVSLHYRGTSLIRKRLPLGPYSSPMPRALWCS